MTSEALAAARTHLLTVLSEVTSAAANSALERCPYRTRNDICTFRGPCQNQQRIGHSPRVCAGGPLNAHPVGREK